MKRPEQALHQQVAQFLAWALPDDAWFTTIGHGGGGLLRGKILHGMGVKPGVPDILVVSGGRAIFVELKAQKGTVSPAQKACISALYEAGSHVHLARNLDQVIAALRTEGVPLRIAKQYDPDADAIGSYYDAIEAIGEDVKAGRRPVPTDGYFGSAKR